MKNNQNLNANPQGRFKQIDIDVEKIAKTIEVGLKTGLHNLLEDDRFIPNSEDVKALNVQQLLSPNVQGANNTIPNTEEYKPSGIISNMIERLNSAPTINIQDYV